MSARAATIALALAASASLPQDQAPVFRSSVDLVSIDVSVQRRGRAVTDLTAPDFELRDNGEVQRLLSIDRETLPIDIVLVTDLSGSVRGPLLAALTRAVNEVGRQVRASDRVRLTVFNNQIRDLGPIDPAHVPLTIGQLGTPSGATSLFDTLTVTLVGDATPDRRQMAVVFTDGADTQSFVDEAAVMEVARRSEMAIFVVAVTDGTLRTPLRPPHEAWLQSLTDVTGGRLEVVQGDGTLDESFARAVETFRTSYVLRYTVSSGRLAGWHDVTVKVTRPGDFDVRARRGYFGGNR